MILQTHFLLDSGMIPVRVTTELLKTESHYDENFVIIGGALGCHNSAVTTKLASLELIFFL